MNKQIALLGTFIVITLCTLSGCANKPDFPNSDHHRDAQFFNPNMPENGAGGLWAGLKILWEFTFNKPDNTVPSLTPEVIALSTHDLVTLPDNQFIRLGHSSLLFKLKGQFWMSDPVFSDRASPLSWAGPKRFHESPIALQDLPAITGVFISHDHYDHLDKQAIIELSEKTKHFLVPLGMSALLQDWGIDGDKITELDWHEAHQVEGVTLRATPAQHFSGRGLSDGNERLWASWVIKTDEVSLFFSGDTGYFDGFKTIGERYGPFDLTFVETGAYDSRWAHIHMMPEQSVQAHIDLQGQWMMPIHNGTFDLAMHTWTDPFERALQAAGRLNVNITTPKMGEAIDILSPQAGSAWWRENTESEK